MDLTPRLAKALPLFTILGNRHVEEGKLYGSQVVLAAQVSASIAI